MNYSYVRVAQLDRASGYGPEGREFESSRARVKPCRLPARLFVLYGFYGISGLSVFRRSNTEETVSNEED